MPAGWLANKTGKKTRPTCGWEPSRPGADTRAAHRHRWPHVSYGKSGVMPGCGYPFVGIEWFPGGHGGGASVRVS
jgi:hypothetical protein